MKILNYDLNVTEYKKKLGELRTLTHTLNIYKNMDKKELLRRKREIEEFSKTNTIKADDILFSYYLITQNLKTRKK